MGIVREMSERLWSGETSTEDRHPFTPLLVTEPLAEGAVFVSSFANVAAVSTGDGLVVVDVGGPHAGPMVLGALRTFSDDPLHAAIYTHGHLDHVAGMDTFDDEAAKRGRPRPRVIAHAAVPARFERYQLTRGWNACINTRQFGLPVKWPETWRQPDETFETTRTLTPGGETVELHHARGETDDATWVWFPSRKVVCAGDLFIWASPNAGNPQKVQRFPREWAVALRRMAALGAEVLSPGHGVPIWGAERVRKALEETAELLEHLHDRTVELMNQGATLDDIIHTVEAPAHLLARPHLKPVYDEPEFIVRHVWRLYGGWWDGNKANLKPARAEELAAAGDFRLACHLAELAAQAAPRDPGILSIRRSLYTRRAAKETSLMAKGIYEGQDP